MIETISWMREPRACDIGFSPPLFEKDIMAVDSPCISICKFDEKTGLCIGCLRTKDECRQWKKMKDKHRARIIDERPRRRANLKKHRK
jgi:predicted Fe-S protein YdhL (DUF1289 family)